MLLSSNLTMPTPTEITTQPCDERKSMMSLLRDCISLGFRCLQKLPGLKLITTTATPHSLAKPTILPSDVPIEEETVPGYSAKDYYPVDPGHLFRNRYRTMAKLGWGSCSTVWLAQDIQRYASSVLRCLCPNTLTGGDGSPTAIWFSKLGPANMPTKVRRNTS